MGNWHRNLFAGIDHTPDVSADARLVVVEAEAASKLPTGVAVAWMDAVGLDRSVPRRGLALAAPAAADPLAGTAGLRVLRPIGPRLRAD